MSVAPFPSDQSFDPETLDAMSSAVAKVCAELGLTSRADRLTELVAQHVIEVAQIGVVGEAAIHQLVLERFKSNPQ